MSAEEKDLQPEEALREVGRLFAEGIERIGRAFVTFAAAVEPAIREAQVAKERLGAPDGTWVWMGDEPEPGKDVLAVRDAMDDVWVRDTEGGWRMILEDGEPSPSVRIWRDVTQYAPLVQVEDPRG